ncbi:MAG: tetratricopeptide repeat protein [Planctomycetota bacterium]
MALLANWSSAAARHWRGGLALPGLLLLALLPAGRLAAQAPGPEAGKRSSPAAVAAYTSAAALQDRGLSSLAEQEWRTLLKQHAGDPLATRARYNLGVCLFGQQKYAAAAEEFSRVAQAKDAELGPQALANLGLARFNEAAQQPDAQGRPNAQRLQQATAAFQQLTTQHPRSDQAATGWLYLGEARAQLGDAGAAARAFREGLRQFPGGPLAESMSLGLISSLLESGEANEAAAAANRLLDQSKDNAIRLEAYRLRGDCRLATGGFEAAAKDFAEAAATDDPAAAAEATSRRAYCLFKLGRYADAVKVYDQLATQWPDTPSGADARLAAAKCLITAKRPQEAAARLLPMWRRDPTAANAQAAHWYARAVIDAGGDAAGAGVVVDAALSTSPDPTWAVELAMDAADLAYQAAGSRSEAAKRYQQLAEQYPDEEIGQRAACLGAHTLLELGQTDSALRLAEQTLSRGVADSLRPALLQVAAEAYDRTGQAEQSIRGYRRLLTQFAGDERAPEWSVRLARGLAKAEQWAEVTQTLTPVLPTLSASLQPEATALLADAAAATGGADEAVAVLSRQIDRLSRQPENGDALVQALYDRGSRLTAQGRGDEARRDFAEVLRRAPDHSMAPFARLALGKSQYGAGQHQECLQTLTPLTSSNQPSLAGPARYLTAAALHETDQHAEALAMLNGAAAPEAELLLLRGVCLGQLGRVRQAQVALEGALAAEGNSAVADRALYELAWLQDGKDRRAKADALFDRLANEHPASSFAAEAALRVGEGRYRAKRFGEAIDRLAKAAASPTADAPTRERALHLLGWSHFEEKDYDAAGKAFTDQLTAAPSGPLAPEGRLMRAECLFASGRLERAAAEYPPALADPQLRRELRALGSLHAGQALGQLERWSESFTILDEAARERSAYEESINYELAWAMQKLGRKNDAATAFARLADRSKSVVSARARFMLGELQFAAGEHEAAVRTFFKVAYGYGGGSAPEAFHAWQSQSLFEAARCLEVLNKPGAARKLYAELVERFPESEKATFARDRLQPNRSP